MSPPKNWMKNNLVVQCFPVSLIFPKQKIKFLFPFPVFCSVIAHFVYCRATFPGGYSKKILIREGSNPFSLCRPFWQKLCPFRIPFIIKPWAEVDEQYYRRTSGISKRDVNQKIKYYLFSSGCGRSEDDSFPYPFVHPNLWISTLLHTWSREW